MTQPTANSGWAIGRRRYKVLCRGKQLCPTSHENWHLAARSSPPPRQGPDVSGVETHCRCALHVPSLCCGGACRTSATDSKRLVRCLLDHSWLSSTLPRRCRRRSDISARKKFRFISDTAKSHRHASLRSAGVLPRRYQESDLDRVLVKHA